MADDQGDQIGPIFAHWVTVNFIEFWGNCKSSRHFWATFFHGYGNALILTKKNCLRYILGHFFKKTHLVTLRDGDDARVCTKTSVHK
jgi:hypothetical protein